MQRSLFLLVLMGQCSFFICHLYEYHFIDEEKTWHEAQKYCREKYTDLATVSNMTDMKRLSAQKKDEAWIGLYNQTDVNRTWHWSLPGVEYNETEKNWDDNEPNDKCSPENCGFIRNTGRWGDTSCEYSTARFICFDERKNKKKFHLHKQSGVKTWTEAQIHCRTHHTDLVSGINQLQDSELMTEIASENTWMWTGLFRDTWTWSDGSSYSFRHWEQQPRGLTQGCALTTNNGRWRNEECGREKPFFCIDDKVILIKEQKTWEEALYYCREHHDDLVTITNLDEQRWVQEKAKSASTPFVWLGLHYTCVLEFWFWVSDNRVTYENWDSEKIANDCDMSAAMDTGGQHKWFKKSDYTEFNFICSEI